MEKPHTYTHTLNAEKPASNRSVIPNKQLFPNELTKSTEGVDTDYTVATRNLIRWQFSHRKQCWQLTENLRG